MERLPVASAVLMELSSLDLNHETASTLGSQGSEACFRRFAGKID